MTHDTFKTIEADMDKLIDGMKPKVSNFGNIASEDVKEKLQELFDMWWANADSFYRNPLKSSLKYSVIKILEQLIEREEKLLNKPNPQELLFDDCPNCGQEINRKWISNKVTEIHDEAKQDTISYLKSEIEKLKGK